VALINWVLVEQRRVEVGIARHELARRSRIDEATLRRLDEPYADDGGISLHQLGLLAAVLDLEPAALLQTQAGEEQSSQGIAYYEQLAHRPRRPASHMYGTDELNRHHSRGSTEAVADGTMLIAALQYASTPLEPGGICNALNWSGIRCAAALTQAASILRRTGLRIRTDEQGRWQLQPLRNALSPGQRQQLTSAGRQPDAAMTAILYQLHRRGPLRIDRFAEEYRHHIAALEQLHLIQRHGAHYQLAPGVRESFQLLGQLGTA